MAVDPSIIHHPNDQDATPGLLESIATNGSALATATSDKTRLDLLESARALVVALEKPRETMIRRTWGEHGLFAVLTFGIDAGVWTHLGAEDKPKNVAELAAATGVDQMTSVMTCRFRAVLIFSSRCAVSQMLEIVTLLVGVTVRA